MLNSVTILINTSFPIGINLHNLIHKIFPIGIVHLHKIILIRLLFYVITVQGSHFKYHFAFIRNLLTIIFNRISKYFFNHFGLLKLKQHNFTTKSVHFQILTVIEQHLTYYQFALVTHYQLFLDPFYYFNRFKIRVNL